MFFLNFQGWKHFLLLNEKSNFHVITELQEQGLQKTAPNIVKFMI